MFYVTRVKSQSEITAHLWQVLPKRQKMCISDNMEMQGTLTAYQQECNSGMSLWKISKTKVPLLGVCHILYDTERTSVPRHHGAQQPRLPDCPSRGREVKKETGIKPEDTDKWQKPGSEGWTLRTSVIHLAAAAKYLTNLRKEEFIWAQGLK